MGQATRTTKLLLDLGKRTQGGANTEKRIALAATTAVLTEARAFYIDFFLAHAQKLAERVTYYSEEHLEMRERLISAHELLSWAEACTVESGALGKERQAEGQAGPACGHGSPHALSGMPRP
jgi:hypothetical protein